MNNQIKLILLGLFVYIGGYYINKFIKLYNYTNCSSISDEKFFKCIEIRADEYKVCETKWTEELNACQSKLN